jgi:hypothetical protein
VTHHSEVTETVTVPTTCDITTTIGGTTMVIPVTKSITTVLTCKDETGGGCDYKPSPDYPATPPPPAATAQMTVASDATPPYEAGSSSNTVAAPAALLGACMAAMILF